MNMDMRLFLDIRPSKIGFTHEGVLKLFDFDMAVVLPRGSHISAKSRRSVSIFKDPASLPYSAPELYLNELHSEKVDIYSFGMVLLRLLLVDDEFPFDDFSVQDFEQEVILRGWRPQLSLRSVPYPLGLLIGSCWAAEAAKRPTSVRSSQHLPAGLLHWHEAVPKKPMQL